MLFIDSICGVFIVLPVLLLGRVHCLHEDELDPAVNGTGTLDLYSKWNGFLQFQLKFSASFSTKFGLVNSNCIFCYRVRLKWDQWNESQNRWSWWPETAVQGQVVQRRSKQATQMWSLGRPHASYYLVLWPRPGWIAFWACVWPTENEGEPHLNWPKNSGKNKNLQIQWAR